MPYIFSLRDTFRLTLDNGTLFRPTNLPGHGPALLLGNLGLLDSSGFCAFLSGQLSADLIGSLTGAKRLLGRHAVRGVFFNFELFEGGFADWKKKKNRDEIIQMQICVCEMVNTK